MDTLKKAGSPKEVNLLAELMQERVVNEENYQKYFVIDLSFYKKYEMDLNTILINRLCAKKCYPRRVQMYKDLAIDDAHKLLENVYKCCSQQPDFIRDDMPLAERIFRIFLKYDNQPLNAHKISKELNYYNFSNIYCLLAHDENYGFKEVEVSKK